MVKAAGRQGIRVGFVYALCPLAMFVALLGISQGLAEGLKEILGYLRGVVLILVMNTKSDAKNSVSLGKFSVTITLT